MKKMRRVLKRNAYTALYCTGWIGGFASQATPIAQVSAMAFKVGTKSP